MKKKTLLLSLVMVIAVLALAGCGSKSPSNVVEDNLKQIKSEDSSSGLDQVFSNANLKKEYKDEFAELVKKVQDFDYKIKDEKVDGDKATVVVEIKTYDFGAAYKDTYNAVLAEASSGNITSTSDIEKFVYDLMFKNLLAVKDKSYTKDVTINCTKKDGEWKTDISTSNTEFQDAIMGGMVTAVTGAIAGN